jgi:threonine dehydrogenase-like Zn-dependent dehydrogenase
VLVETECTAVSPGTELAFLQAKSNTCGTFPQYPGYSGVGRILEVGEGVEGFTVGERILMDHCGHASHCLCEVGGWRGQGLTKIEDESIRSQEAAFVVIASMSIQGVRIVLLGCTRELNEGINFYESVHKTGVSIIGAHNFVRPLRDSSPGYWTSLDDLRVLLSLLRAGRLQVKPLITEETVPENAPDVYARFLDHEEGMLGVVFNWQA